MRMKQFDIQKKSSSISNKKKNIGGPVGRSVSSRPWVFNRETVDPLGP